MKARIKNQFPANPLAIFTLVEKLANANKGNSLLSNIIRNAFKSTNYYRIIKEVKEMAKDNKAAIAGQIGLELTEEILQFEIPEYLIKH